MKSRPIALALVVALVVGNVAARAQDPAPAPADPGALISAVKATAADQADKTTALDAATKAKADADRAADQAGKALIADLASAGPVVDLSTSPPTLYQSSPDGASFVARPIRSTGAQAPPPVAPPAAALPKAAGRAITAAHRLRYPSCDDRTIALILKAESSPGR